MSCALAEYVCGFTGSSESILASHMCVHAVDQLQHHTTSLAEQFELLKQMHVTENVLILCKVVPISCAGSPQMY